MANSTINSVTCVKFTVFDISIYLFIDKYPLVIKYITGIFNFRIPNQKK